MTAWRHWGRYTLAAAVSVAICWVAFGAHRPVPFLDQFDLAVHEASHFLTAFLPDTVMFLAGSAGQVLLPLGLATYFLWRRKEWASAGFCVAWAATSARDVSVYIADAPVQALPLVGGGTHDWAWLLGGHGCGCLNEAGAIARGVEIFGLALAVVGVGMCVWPLGRRLLGRSRVAAPVMSREESFDDVVAPPPAFAWSESDGPADPFAPA